MREILFRGKREDNGEWVYGDLLHDYASQGDTIRQGAAYGKSGYFAIVPDTIGQYTGLTDKNGTKIFEGDVVRNYGISQRRSVVTWDNKNMCNIIGFRLAGVKGYHNITSPIGIDVKVIGNIHDNPELIKGDKK